MGTAVTIGLFFTVPAIGFAVVTALHVLLARPAAAQNGRRQIESGRIVARGAHDELLAADGRYTELYRTQFEQRESEAPGPVAAAGEIVA
ncbi:hypothetical protein [Streptomyces sp. NBC_00078]|uniref:hypothetical protein n=1 Tax=unclassified Streptomyces TaxID=2593676 RepID=UPI00224F5A89|nr:hypothetical protein [Streptomyces sp. NBC_00078]MCX5424646.1 hypothetical protein [Streptomyces sp. NBC_00078]